MASSLATVPRSHVEPTGPYNVVEIVKFLRLCAIWIALIFTPVWLASWAVGELVPWLIINVGFNGGRPNDAGIAAIQICRALVPLIAVMVFIPINAMFMVLCERRALALFTVRKGPNRVGPDGLLQTAADAVKLLFKEDITPQGADAVMFTAAPIIFFAPSIFGAMPLLAAVTFNHPLFATMHLPTGIFFVLAMSAIPVVALVMGGWASNNKYSLVGGLRSAAQAISYEIPLVMSIITVCYMNGTLDVVHVAMMQSVPYQPAVAQADAQSLIRVQSMDPSLVWTPATTTAADGAASSSAMAVPAAPKSPGLLQWNLFGKGVFNAAVEGPHDGGMLMARILGALVLVVCSFILMGMYMTGACAEINRIPFDLPEAESELVSGYNTEYSGIKFAIFFLAEFTNLFIVATVATVMFLGGGSSPIPGFLDPWMFQQLFGAIGGAIGPHVPSPVMWFLGSLLNPVTFSMWLWTTIKVYSIVVFAILVRGTLPRFRIDQLMDFSWKRLIPLSLILFLGVAFLMEFIYNA